MRYAVVDTETTGLHPRKGDQLLTMAVYIVDTEAKNWPVAAFEFRPRQTIKYLIMGTGPKKARQAHGISRKRANASRQTFEQQADRIAEMLAGCVFVAHNVNFDAEFINAAFESIGRKAPVSDRLCTGRMAAQMLDDPRGYTSLKKACAGLGIEQVRHHDALDDTRCAAEILKKWLEAQR